MKLGARHLRARRAGVRRGRAAAGARDPLQANILGALALVFGAGGVILPLPLGLAGILLAGWGRWRHGRTAFGTLALLGAAALTLAGIVIGASL